MITAPSLQLSTSTPIYRLSSSKLFTTWLKPKRRKINLQIVIAYQNHSTQQEISFHFHVLHCNTQGRL
ncbi:hypothetical protein NDU88_009489 [Pleurodeles waltl]|uniref:Uncharacterized protein n=1 Tax=Pleurodeles waltl TaxID=8319 RepID=A0AAV7QXG6_PLEWA|nr:hypothetical protein NDU88_009489 [Pleurodeles waltl]